MSVKIKKGDTVKVIAGKDKGATGRVLEVITERDKVVVEGVNRIKKHTKVGQTARGAKTGGIVTTEAGIHISNVMLAVEKDGKRVGSRVGIRKDEDGRSIRVSRRTGKDL